MNDMEIGIWGDSITYGAGDDEALGWVGRVRKSLFNESETEVYNFGVCGDTTENLLKRFSVEAKGIQPDKIVFAVGINDSKYPPGETANKVSIEKFKQNIQTLLSEARKFTDKIFVVSATKVDSACESWGGTRFLNTEIQRYNATLRECTKAANSIFIDVFESLDTSTDLADGLHPNASGYQKLFLKIGSEIK